MKLATPTGGRIFSCSLATSGCCAQVFSPFNTSHISIRYPSAARRTGRRNLGRCVTQKYHTILPNAEVCNSPHASLNYPPPSPPRKTFSPNPTRRYLQHYYHFCLHALFIGWHLQVVGQDRGRSAHLLRTSSGGGLLSLRRKRGGRKGNPNSKNDFAALNLFGIYGQGLIASASRRTECGWAPSGATSWLWPSRCTLLFYPKCCQN